MYIDGNVFPSSVLECDITEEVLQRAFLQCLEGQGDLDLILMKPVTIGFYRDLHHYLSHWPLARSATKTSVGKFYALIDVNFKLHAARPDNVYAFVKKVADSTRSRSEPMYYGLEKTLKRLENAVCGYQKTLKEMSHTVTEQQED